MKNIARNLCFGRDSKITLVLVLGVFAFVSLGCLDSFRRNDTRDAPTSNNRREDAPPPSNTPAPERTRSTNTKAGNNVPSDADLEGLVQNSLQDFADAVDSEDFTAFRDSVSKPFKTQFSAEKFKEAFQAFINVKSSVVPTLRSTSGMTPTYSPDPNVATQSGYKVLNANGTYDTSPLPTKFELQYINEGGQWKLIKIRVEVR